MINQKIAVVWISDSNSKTVDIYSFMFKYCKIEENATLLDCFGGSGNIAIACDKEKLNLDICEIDETYYQKSKLSYETFKRCGWVVANTYLPTPLAYILKTIKNNMTEITDLKIYDLKESIIACQFNAKKPREYRRRI